MLKPRVRVADKVRITVWIMVMISLDTHLMVVVKIVFSVRISALTSAPGQFWCTNSTNIISANPNPNPCLSLTLSVTRNLKTDFDPKPIAALILFEHLHSRIISGPERSL